jgi:hypothetical protein
MSVITCTLFYLHLTVVIMAKLINANGVLKYKLHPCNCYKYGHGLQLHTHRAEACNNVTQRIFNFCTLKVMYFLTAIQLYHCHYLCLPSLPLTTDKPVFQHTIYLSNEKKKCYCVTKGFYNSPTYIRICYFGNLISLS